MAYVSAVRFGNHNAESIYGEPLQASDGNGDLRTWSENLSAKGSAPEFVTPEELTHLIQHAAAKDIARGELTFPPDVDDALRLAQSFFEVYLIDTDVDRVEVVDRYVAELIELLEADEAATFEPTFEEVEEYVRQVHTRLLDELSAERAPETEVVLVA